MHISAKPHELRWKWIPGGRRTKIVGERNPFRRLFYRIILALGWRPFPVVFSEMVGPDDPSDELSGSRVPRRPPDSSGSAAATATPLEDPVEAGDIHER